MRGLAMKRNIEKKLLSWKEQKNRLPLLIRGARQVGKTYLVEKFGRTHFKSLIAINFELQPEFCRCFDNLHPQHIINMINLLTNQTIIPGETLLFLDEIQDCPNAIKALRYFKEKLPALHVIGAGSLLEFTLNDASFRMPVGRVQFLYLRPLSFQEFLNATGHSQLQQYLTHLTLTDPIAAPIHKQLLKLVREYIVLGGMPAVLQEYINSEDFAACQAIQSSLLQTYRHDFGKYASKTHHKYLQRLFEKAPGLVAQHFKYVSVDPEMRSRDIKSALEMLQYAGLIHFVYATTASGIPLRSLINTKKFKLLFLDVGLIKRATKLEAELLMQNNLLLINRGLIAEQLVGQELLAYSDHFDDGELYFWSREQKSSTAEVDFVITIGPHIYPIEVKSGTTGHLKSLKLFMDEKSAAVGIRISQHPLSFHEKILSVPLYLIGELPRLVNRVQEQ